MQHEPDELTGEFLAESRDNLQGLEAALLALESAPSDRGLLDTAFRAVHTIKGTCGFIGFPALGNMTHAGEDLLGALRDRHAPVAGSAISLLLQMADWVARVLDGIAATGQETSALDAVLLDALRKAAAAVAANAIVARDSVDPALPAPVSTALPDAAASAGVRVRADVLEDVIEAAGKLILARNQIERLAAHAPEALRPLLEEVDRIATDLRHSAVRLRLQPVESILSRCPRVARDISSATGKQIQLTLEGLDIELDRAVLDAVRDPLLHCVRNAADHGIEAPEVRLRAGKCASGTITVRAARQGAQVLVEITDDGAGISTDGLLAKALRTGVRTAAQAARMTLRQTLELVFEPGMTTAQQVTSFSGRGVGMDVVRTCVEAIGGQVDLENRPGQGLTVRMLLPLTLAIFPAAIVRSHLQCFGLPFAALEQVVSGRDFRVDRQAGLLFLDSQTLPLADLRELAGQPARSRAERDMAVVLVLAEANRRFALIVDEVLETEQVVIKPLQPCLRENGLYNGAATLGSGTPSRFLDLQGIAVLLERRTAASPLTLLEDTAEWTT